jgi:hypothetical protein
MQPGIQDRKQRRIVMPTISLPEHGHSERNSPLLDPLV